MPRDAKSMATSHRLVPCFDVSMSLFACNFYKQFFETVLWKTLFFFQLKRKKEFQETVLKNTNTPRFSTPFFITSRNLERIKELFFVQNVISQEKKFLKNKFQNRPLDDFLKTYCGKLILKQPNKLIFLHLCLGICLDFQISRWNKWQWSMCCTCCHPT